MSRFNLTQELVDNLKQAYVFLLELKLLYLFSQMKYSTSLIEFLNEYLVVINKHRVQ